MREGPREDDPAASSADPLARTVEGVDPGRTQASGAGATEGRTELDTRVLVETAADDAPAASVPASVGGATGSYASGDRIGRYRLVSALGLGGMGLVFLAHDDELDRPVALKVLRPGGNGDSRRLLREARSMARLGHPHIAAVYDVGTHGGDVYVAMEYVEGPTLRAWMKAPRSWAERLEVLVQAARGLAEAHGRGVTHRDFKPENVIVGRDGRVRVLDFGLAKLAPRAAARADDTTDTQIGVVVGTPRYMAPEQAAGLECDARTDVYAFGTVLFELLAAKPPFESTVYGQLAADIITRPPPPVPTITRTGDAVPEALRKLVTACLAKNADHRPQTMTEVLRRLRHLDEDLGDFAPVVSTRPRWMLPVALLTSLALVAGIGAAVLGGGTKPAPTPPAPALPTLPAPAVTPVEPAVALPPKTISLGIDSVPQGATVTEGGTKLGVTPLVLERPAHHGTVKVTLELKGHETLTREFATTENLRVELPLKRAAVAPVKKQTRAVTDGVMEAY